MKVTLITTFFNEEDTVLNFIESISSQTTRPDEVILIDGGSTDSTVKKVKDFIKNNPSLKILFFIKKGNRSVGRNEAVRKATNDIIVCSDVGCVLDRKWVEEITKPFHKKGVDVVAGYYDSKPTTLFQKCVVPYALVMPDKINPETFLPATRSIAFTKNAWKKVNGFNEKYSHNEDYVFARELKKAHMTIIFSQKAVVYWIPRNTFCEVYAMIWRFAYGDAEAGIIRPKVVVLFLRYTLGMGLITTALITQSTTLLLACCLLFVGYLAWSIMKNYRYVHEVGAIIILPLLQITADLAVISGTTKGRLSH